MKTKILALILLVFSQFAMAGITIVERPEESITIYDSNAVLQSSQAALSAASQNTKQIIANTNNGNSIESIVGFADIARRRMSTAGLAGKVRSIVTLKSALTEQEINNLAAEYTLTINSAKFTSTQGGGTAPWPIDAPFIAEWENQT